MTLTREQVSEALVRGYYSKPRREKWDRMLVEDLTDSVMEAIDHGLSVGRAAPEQLRLEVLGQTE